MARISVSYWNLICLFTTLLPYSVHLAYRHLYINLYPLYSNHTAPPYRILACSRAEAEDPAESSDTERWNSGERGLPSLGLGTGLDNRGTMTSSTSRTSSLTSVGKEGVEVTMLFIDTLQDRMFIELNRPFSQWTAVVFTPK